jgi:hypothetical protein
MRLEGIVYRLRRGVLFSKSFINNFFAVLYAILKDLFYDNLPSDDIRDLPSIHVFTLGSLIYFISFSAFIVFIVIGYISTRNSKFLAVSTDSGECVPVPKTVSGTFLADINGEWEGSDSFIYSRGIYSFTMPNYAGNDKEYADMMLGAFYETNYMGQQGYQRNLGINILVWTVFSSTIRRGGSANKFSMSGSPRAIFDRRIYSAAFGSVAGQCPIRPLISYNTESAQLTLLFNYEQFISTSECQRIIDPHHIGYLDYYSGNNFQIVFDARSALTALAINSGFLDINELEMIPGTQFTESFSSSDLNLTVARYYYPRYPGMRPLVCVLKPLICILQIYEIYLYPLFNHLGNNPTKPSYCDCTKPEMLQGDGCNLFNFVTSFAFFDFNSSAGETAWTAINKLVQFSQASGRTGEEINHESFNATFYTGANLEKTISPTPTHIGAGIEYSKSFEFCKVESSYCNLLSVVMFDGFQIVDGIVYHPGSEYTVSDNYYQVRYGACNDSFTIPLSSQEKLAANPPFPLQEPYYQCRETKSSAFITAWGVSSGNMATVVPLLVVLVLTLFVTYSNLKFRPIPKTYSTSEKSDVLDYLAFNLLLIRDQRYSSGLPGRFGDSKGSKSPLMELYGELSQHEMIPKFFYEKDSISPHAMSAGSGDVVLDTTTNGVMMTDTRMRNDLGLNQSTSTRKTELSQTRMYSEDAVITESQYDQLMNPLHVQPPPSSPLTP